MPLLSTPTRESISTANLIPSSYFSYFVTPSLRANAVCNHGRFTLDQYWRRRRPFQPGLSVWSSAVQARPKVRHRGFANWYRAGCESRPETSLRGDLRDFWSGTPNINVDTGKTRQHNFLIGIGVVYRFGKS